MYISASLILRNMFSIVSCTKSGVHFRPMGNTFVRMSDCLEGIEPCKCKGKGHQWMGNQVFRLLELRNEMKKKRSEISGRDLQKPFGGFKNIYSFQDDKILCHHHRDINEGYSHTPS
jgi:hypothetical protein